MGFLSSIIGFGASEIETYSQLRPYDRRHIIIMFKRSKSFTSPHKKSVCIINALLVVLNFDNAQRVHLLVITNYLW